MIVVECRCCAGVSPDLNPIELPFSKLKASLRKAAERGRSRNGTKSTR
jgi:transposase